jgi:hypothetical protein
MAAMPKPPRRSGNGGRRAARLSVKKMDWERRGHQAEIDPPASGRQVNAAMPVRSNFLCLEHKLQTVVDGGFDAAAITLGAHGIGGRFGSTSRCRRTPHGKLQLPCSFKDIGVALSSAGACPGAGTDRKLRPPAPLRSGAIVAGVPDALTGHNRNL